jgi:hypothetical protein
MIRASHRSFTILAVVFLLALGAGAAAAGQLKPEVSARLDFWEDFLRTAEIVDAHPIGEGVTKPWRLTLEKDGVRHDAAWKDVDRMVTNRGERIRDSWKSDVAAYRIDKLIGLNLVPPYVEREFAPPPSKKERPGSLSYWAESKMNYLKMLEQNIAFPEDRTLDADRMKYLVRLWDCLIANADRTQENILLTEDWRTILIDHSRAFQSDARFSRQLIFGQDGMQRFDAGRPLLIRLVPRALYDRILALDEKKVRDAAGPYLTDRQIKGILARVDLIRKEVEQMVKLDGEAKVFY